MQKMDSLAVIVLKDHLCFLNNGILIIFIIKLNIQISEIEVGQFNI